MANIINAEEEIANSAIFSEIRFTAIQNTIDYEENDDLDIVLDFPWSDPSYSEGLAEMSGTYSQRLAFPRVWSPLTGEALQ